MLKYTLYVPTAHVDNPDVRDGVDTLRWIAGGRTDSVAAGSWLSETAGMISEPITRFEYLLPNDSGDPKVRTFDAKLSNVANVLKHLGEESVLVEITESEAWWL